jgi:hypothetical protein
MPFHVMSQRMLERDCDITTVRMMDAMEALDRLVRACSRNGKSKHEALDLQDTETHEDSKGKLLFGWDLKFQDDG